MVGVARMELVRTLRGSDDIVRMLRIVHAILRHVGTMGRFFSHYSIAAVNVCSKVFIHSTQSPNLCRTPVKGATASAC